MSQDISLDLFTDKYEIEKRKKLYQLTEEWKSVINTKDKITFRDDNKQYDAIDYFNSDGFFPGYFRRNMKVLFIGRESRWVSNGDRIKSDIDWLKNNSPNGSSYWRRLLYILYGIENEGRLKFQEIPAANEILAKMIEDNNFGFAIMNISKYANESDNGANADYSLINRFLIDSELDKKNFIREEIKLLEPDVIITANLWWENKISEEYLNKVFPEKDFINLKDIDGIATLFNFRIDEMNIKLIDLYHFTARKKIDEKDFYEPVMDLLFQK